MDFSAAARIQALSGLDLDQAADFAQAQKPILTHRETDDLLLRVQSRDRQAFALLLDRYARLVLSIGNRVLHDPNEAEDLVQDVFLFLWSHSTSFDPQRGSGHDWLVRIIYHRALDRRRYLTVRTFYSLSSGGDTGDVSAFGAPCHVGAREGNAGELLYWQAVLGAALRGLTERQRTTLTLFFYDGYTLGEISTRLGEPLGNIRHYYYRGLQRLRKSVCRSGSEGL
jgi:RNA polymerase sigma-70 factor (ECF subfamily)